jgi:methyl-accepting chemotaxis protein
MGLPFFNTFAPSNLKKAPRMKKMVDFILYPLIVGIMLLILSPILENIGTWRNTVFFILVIVEIILISWAIIKIIRQMKEKAENRRKSIEFKIKELEDIIFDFIDEIRPLKDRVETLERDNEFLKQVLKDTQSIIGRVVELLPKV